MVLLQQLQQNTKPQFRQWCFRRSIPNAAAQPLQFDAAASDCHWIASSSSAGFAPAAPPPACCVVGDVVGAGPV